MSTISFNVPYREIQQALLDNSEDIVKHIWQDRKTACVNAAGEVLDENGYLPNGTRWFASGDTVWFVVEKDGKDLTHYFYEGLVYGPNFLITRGKLAGEWRSPKNKKKFPTGDYLNQYPYAPSGVRHWTEALDENGDLRYEFEERVGEILRR